MLAGIARSDRTGPLHQRSRPTQLEGRCGGGSPPAAVEARPPPSASAPAPPSRRRPAVRACSIDARRRVLACAVDACCARFPRSCPTTARASISCSPRVESCTVASARTTLPELEPYRGRGAALLADVGAPSDRATLDEKSSENVLDIREVSCLAERRSDQCAARDRQGAGSTTGSSGSYSIPTVRKWSRSRLTVRPSGKVQASGDADAQHDRERPPRRQRKSSQPIESDPARLTAAWIVGPHPAALAEIEVARGDRAARRRAHAHRSERWLRRPGAHVPARDRHGAAADLGR